ncbi:MAG: hypothetical protein NTW19_02505 [Planctomycetota bacterium]|nr:hypothetical protein [Planctomycetota bacterium]
MSTFPDVFGVAGFAAETSHVPRIVLAGRTGATYLPQGRVIDGSLARDPLNTGDTDVLRNGLLMGKVSASGKFAPSVLGVTAAAYNHTGSTSTQLQVGAAVATEIARRIGSSGSFKITGPPTAAGVVATETVAFSAVNASTGVVTITAAAANYVAGSLVRPADGSETPLGILDETLKVTDARGQSQDTRLKALLIAGVVDTSQILNVPADASLLAWLKAQLRATGLGWAFDDDFGF